MIRSSEEKTAADSLSLPPAQGGLQNSLYTVGTRAISGFTRAGILFLIASRYGPVLFGKLVLAISIMEIFRTFSEFGVDTIAIRRFSQSAQPDAGTLLGRILSAKLVTATTSYLLALAIVVAITRDPVELHLAAITSASLWTANAIGAFSSYFQSHLQMVRVFWRMLCAAAVYGITSAVAASWHAPLVLVVALLPACEALNCWLLYLTCEQRPYMRFSIGETICLLRESLPVGLMSAMLIVCFRLDSILIFGKLGSAALGVYAAGYRLVEPALMVPHAFATTLYALLCRRTAEPLRGRRLLAAVRHTMWPAYLFIVGTAGMLLLSGRIVLQHFGTAYVDAYPVLKLLSVALVLRTVNLTLTAVLNSRSMYVTLAKITGANLIINLALTLALIPQFGIRGAAFAIIITEVANLAAQFRSCLTSAPSAKPVYVLNVGPECE